MKNENFFSKEEIKERVENEPIQNKKIQQEADLLTIDESFIKDINALRKKYLISIKENKKELSVLEKETEKKLSKLTKKKKDKLSALTSEFIEKKMDIFSSFVISKIILAVKNENFQKELIILCKKYKTFPMEYWQYFVLTFVLFDQFIPMDNLFLLKLKNYISPKEIIFRPDNLNFGLSIVKNKDNNKDKLFIQIFESTSSKDIRENWQTIINYAKKLEDEREKKNLFSIIIKNEITNEEELFVQIFKNTTQREIEKNWNKIIKKRDKLRVKKGIKRFYSFGNIPFMKKILNLQKKKIPKSIIQEKLYGEIKDVNFGEKEKRRENSTYQRTYRFKKRKKN
jgi:hypothetical protein